MDNKVTDNMTRGELCELQYEYQRYCMYCVDPVDFETFAEREILAKKENLDE